jgi:hypothetical protein
MNIIKMFRTNHGYLLTRSKKERVALVVPALEVVPPRSRFPLKYGDVGGVQGLTVPFTTNNINEQELNDDIENDEENPVADDATTPSSDNENDSPNTIPFKPLGIWPSKKTPRRMSKQLSKYLKKQETPPVPFTKNQLLPSYTLRSFHARCFHCQNSTNLYRWSRASDAYTIQENFIETYEPYIIISTESIR